LISFGLRSDLENPDGSIGETSIEVLLILGEDQGDASNTGGQLANLLSFEGRDFVSVDEFLARQVIDSDALVGTDYEPEVLGGERNDVDWGVSINLFKMLSLN